MALAEPAQLMALLQEAFPRLDVGVFQVESVSDAAIRVRQAIRPIDERPGGTVSGPTLMALADTATYLAVLARRGRELLAVTSSLTIHFLRKPDLADLVADATLLKFGRRLVVADVHIRNVGRPDVVAVATVTYALP